jgi:peptide chain release factor
MVDFPVSESKRTALLQRLIRLGLREQDFEEIFTPSRGPGGQHVNKSSTSVSLHHIPSGLRVRCDSTRSQSLNRYLARKRFADKWEERLKGCLSEEKARQEKIRRQKRRRSRRAKEKMLIQKHHQAEKKQRRCVSPQDLE